MSIFPFIGWHQTRDTETESGQTAARKKVLKINQKLDQRVIDEISNGRANLPSNAEKESKLRASWRELIIDRKP